MGNGCPLELHMFQPCYQFPWARTIYACCLWRYGQCSTQMLPVYQRSLQEVGPNHPTRHAGWSAQDWSAQDANGNEKAEELIPRSASCLTQVRHHTCRPSSRRVTPKSAGHAYATCDNGESCVTAHQVETPVAALTRQSLGDTEL